MNPCGFQILLFVDSTITWHEALWYYMIGLLSHENIRCTRPHIAHEMDLEGRACQQQGSRGQHCIVAGKR